MIRTRRFPGRRESITAARQFARDAVRERPAETRDAIELMVSELATNCVEHARSDFELAIELSPRAIRVEARDEGPGRPTPRSPAPSEPSGRGLRIVEAMSDDWGVGIGRDEKIVWFTIRANVSAPTYIAGGPARGA